MLTEITTTQIHSCTTSVWGEEGVVLPQTTKAKRRNDPQPHSVHGLPTKFLCDSSDIFMNVSAISVCINVEYL